MRNVILSLCLAAAAQAQQSRHEVVKATTPKDDAKDNSASVPDVYAINGQFKRVVVLRFKYKTDLLAGLEKMIKEQKIRNAVLLSGVGSVRKWSIHSVSNNTFPSKNVFIQDPSEPADIIGVNGYVIDGRLHGHMTLTTGDKAFGGHIEAGNEVFTFAIITLGVMEDGADFSKLDDKTYR